MLTVAQAAQIYGVSKATVRKWIQRGHITRTRRGLIDKRQLNEWWDQRDTRRIGRTLQQVT